MANVPYRVARKKYPLLKRFLGLNALERTKISIAKERLARVLVLRELAPEDVDLEEVETILIASVAQIRRLPEYDIERPLRLDRDIVFFGSPHFDCGMLFRFEHRDLRRLMISLKIPGRVVLSNRWDATLETTMFVLHFCVLCLFSCLSQREKLLTKELTRRL